MISNAANGKQDCQRPRTAAQYDFSKYSSEKKLIEIHTALLKMGFGKTVTDFTIPHSSFLSSHSVKRKRTFAVYYTARGLLLYRIAVFFIKCLTVTVITYFYYSDQPKLLAHTLLNTISLDKRESFFICHQNR